jgi:hypothetical protein
MVKKMKWPGLISDIYYIFDDGRIWSKYKKGFLKPTPDGDGYLAITLHVGNKDKKIPVHKLMEYNYMDMSIKKNFKDPTVDHIDSNRQNNKYTNLRYLERGENTRRGKHYINQYHHSKLTPEDVHLICQMYKWGWKPLEILDSKIFDISIATLYQIRKKNAWSWIGELYF